MHYESHQLLLDLGEFAWTLVSTITDEFSMNREAGGLASSKETVQIVLRDRETREAVGMFYSIQQACEALSILRWALDAWIGRGFSNQLGCCLVM